MSIENARNIDHAMLLLEQRIREQDGSACMLFAWIKSRFANISERHRAATTSIADHKPEWRLARFADVYEKQGGLENEEFVP